MQWPPCTFGPSPPMVWVHSTPHSHHVLALIPIVTPRTANTHEPPRPFSACEPHPHLTSGAFTGRLSRFDILTLQTRCGSSPCFVLTHMVPGLTWMHQLPDRSHIIDCFNSSTLNSKVISGWLTEKVNALCVIGCQINFYKPIQPNLLPQTQDTTLSLSSQRINNVL